MAGSTKHDDSLQDETAGAEAPRKKQTRPDAGNYSKRSIYQMVTSLRKILLCLMAVFAVGAVASASASAVQRCHAENGDNELTACLKNGEEPTELTGTSGTSILESKVLGVTVKITCTQDKFTAKPSATKDNEGTATITFEKCTVTAPKNCKLPKAQEEKIVANANSKLGPGVREATFTGSGTGEKFTEITLENNGAENCAIKNTYTITGNTGKGCTWDAEIESFLEKHTLTCVKKEEKLKLGANEASFSSTATVLAPKGEVNEPWAIRES